MPSFCNVFGSSRFRLIRCWISCCIIITYQVNNLHAQCCHSYSYADTTGWTLSGTGYTISSDTFRFNATPGATYNFATHPLGCTLSDYSWIGEIDFKYVGRGIVGPAHTLFSVTAGTLNSWNINGASYNSSDQDAIEVYINSPPYGPQSTDSILGRAKNGSVWNIPSRGIYLSMDTIYYIRIERVSPSQGRISLFTNAARTIHAAGSPQYFPIGCDITGLTTLQHGCIPQGAASRGLTGILANPNICDTIKPLPIVIDTVICKGITSFSGHAIDSPGLYVDTIPSVASCDSIVILNVAVRYSRSIVDTTICKKYTSPSGRFQIDTSVTIIDTISNHLGCDSIITINITSLNTRSTFDTAVCDKYLSPSGRFLVDTNMMVIDTISNHVGCDSIMTIHVKVLHTRSTIDTFLCGSYLSVSGKYTANTSMILQDTILNAKGCDSIITIHVHILSSQSIIDTSVCEHMQSPSAKYIWITNGTYLDTIHNTKGCDSVMTIHVRIKKSGSILDTSFCGHLISPSGRYTYTTGGTYWDTLTNAEGCDSVISIHFNQMSKSGSVSIHTCKKYLSPSGRYEYTASGIYKDTISSVNHCDSIITLDLTIEPFTIQVSKTNDISCDSPYAILNVTKGLYYAWSPSSFLNDSTVGNPVVSPEQKEIYHITVTDNSGCTASDSIEVDVNKDEKIREMPNVFTPNNDGFNDQICLENVTLFKQVECSIFNRWGNPVFQSVDPHDCWNGKNSSGTYLSEGVYFFVLKGLSVCGTKITQHGTIQLMR